MLKVTPKIEEVKTSLSALEIFELIKDEPYSFFLDSSSASSSINRLNRYSFMGSKPFIIFRSKGKSVELIHQDSIEKLDANPFDILESLLNDYKITHQENSLPFQCGVVGYFGYELYRFIENKIPLKMSDDVDIPECYLGFYDPVIIYDHLKEKPFISSCGFAGDSRKRREKIKKVLTRTRAKTSLYNPVSGDLSLDTKELKELDLRSNFTKDEYIKAILKIKEYIASGDVYQVNMSQRFWTNFDSSPFELYKHLRKINPAPFSSFLNFDKLKVVSSSPERFLKVTDRAVETRPVKGTRPRGINKRVDDILKNELLLSQKDRAEHVMIVDLERNDLGRICDYNSIRVKELGALEEYATVFHLTSTIEGRLSKGKGPIDCLRACFPGGSITGAPKIRSMEIIDELEPTRRDIYTGSIGYIGFDGNMDSSIVIRTLLIKDKKAYLYAGGGIVSDSDPQEEYEETINKVKALIIALNNRKVLHKAA